MKRTCTFLIALSLMLISFNVKATVVYTQMNLTADQTSTWLWFVWGPDSDGFGLWVNPGSALRVETYQDAVVGVDEGGMVYLSAISYETAIGPESDWKIPVSASYINDATHTALNGTTFYAGFKLSSTAEEIFYGWMQLMVAADGLSVTLIDVAYEDQPGTPILAGVVDRQVVYGWETFTEDMVTNDGHIMNPINIQLLGVNFVITSGAMTQNTHFSVENVPAGLTVEIVATDAINAVIYLNGQAQSHQIADTVNNLTISFLDAAFDGVAASEITNAVKPNLFVKYFGDYELVYEDLPDPVCGTGGWAPFQNLYFENYFGIWHDGTDMRLETYGKDVIGEVIVGKSYVTALELDTEINQESAWVVSGAWPDESYLTSATYNQWLGQDKYAGIKLILGEAVMYGWVHLGVSAEGTEITVFDWAFNTKPGETIKAGQKDNTGINTSNENQMAVYPNPCKNNLTLFAEGLSGNTTLKMMDLLGKTHLNQIVDFESQNQSIINISDFPAGVYILQLTNEHRTITQKVIKE